MDNHTQEDEQHDAVKRQYISVRLNGSMVLIPIDDFNIYEYIEELEQAPIQLGLEMMTVEEYEGLPEFES